MKLKMSQIYGKTFHTHGLEKLILLKVHTTQSNLQIQHKIPIKILVAVFTEWEEITLKFVQNRRRAWTAKAIVKKNKVGGVMIPDFQIHSELYFTKQQRSIMQIVFLLANAGKLANELCRQWLQLEFQKEKGNCLACALCCPILDSDTFSVLCGMTSFLRFV